MKAESLISVIIPCYNASAFLRECLESVLNQTYKNLEIILVNDGSTDQSEDIIHSYTDSRIRYFFQENKGQCAASNLGISVATGEYIKFLDADDVMNPVHLEMQARRMDGNEDALVSCAWGRFYNNDPYSAIFTPESVWKDMMPLDWLKSALSQKYDMMGAWLWLIPRNILQKAGGWDERLSLNNDFEFSIRLLLNADRVLFAEEARIYYRSGMTNALSQTASEKRFQEAVLATDLGCSHLLEAENTPEMRLICANRYQEWLFRIYPNLPDLQDEMENKIRQLGGSSRKMDGGRVFRFLDNMIGWRRAKLIQLKLRSMGYKKLPFN